MDSTTLRRAPRALTRVLALAGFALIAATTDAAAQLPSPFAHMPEVASYRMTTPALQQFVRATNALKALEGENIDMDDQLDVDDPSELSVERIAAAFDSEPRVRAAIEGAGMSTREYVTFLMSMIQTVMGSVMVQMGGEQTLAQMPDGVLKHNIRFFLDNQSVFESLDES